MHRAEMENVIWGFFRSYAWFVYVFVFLCACACVYAYVCVKNHKFLEIISI